MITQKKTSEQCFDKGIHLTPDLKHTRIFADALQLNDFKSSWQSNPHFNVVTMIVDTSQRISRATVLFNWLAWMWFNLNWEINSSLPVAPFTNMV